MGRDGDNKLVRVCFSRLEISDPNNCVKKANCRGTNCVCLLSADSRVSGGSWSCGHFPEKRRVNKREAGVGLVAQRTLNYIEQANLDW